MSDIARLGVVVDTSTVDPATGKLRKFAATGKDAGKAADDLGRKSRGAASGVRTLGKAASTAGPAVGGVSKAVGQTGKMSGAASAGLRNFSFQLSQVAQQGSITGNYLGALAIQLPDMLLSFGTFGALAGVAAVALTPFVSKLFESTDLTKAFRDSMDTLNTSMASFKAASALAGTSTDELKEKFGQAAGAVRGLYLELAQFEAGAVQAQIDGIAASLADLYAIGGDGDKRMGVADFFDVNIGLAFTRAAKEARAEARGLTAEFVNQQNALREANGDLEAQIAALTDMLDTTKALADLSGDRNAEEQDLIRSMTEALVTMQEQRGEVEELNRLTLSTADAARAAAAAFGSAIGPVDTLVGKVAALATNAWSFATAMAADKGAYAASVGPGRGGDPRKFGGSFRDIERDNYAVQLARLRDWEPPALRGGGGASSKAAKALADSLTDAEKAAQRFAKSMEDIASDLRGEFADILGKILSGQGGGFGGILGSIQSGIGNTISGVLKNTVLGPKGAIGGAIGSFYGGVQSFSTNLLTKGVGAAFKGLGTAAAGATSGLSGLAAAAGAAALPVAGVLGIASLFKKKTVARGIRGNVSGTDLTDLRRYTTKKNFFGKSTNNSALDDGTSAALQNQFAAITGNVRSLVGAIGAETADLAGFTTSFKVNLKGLSDEQAAQAIAQNFARIEGAMLEFAFGEAATAMLGGVQGLAESLSFYYDNFFSAAEKQQRIVQSAKETLNDVFGELGIAIPKSVASFRMLVESLDLTTEAGQRTFASLMGVADEFIAAYGGIEEKAAAATGRRGVNRGGAGRELSAKEQFARDNGTYYGWEAANVAQASKGQSATPQDIQNQTDTLNSVLGRIEIAVKDSANRLRIFDLTGMPAERG